MKIVIIGYGGMGGYHAGCLKSYSESAPEAPVEVVGVYDIDPERAAAGEKAGYKAYKSPEEIWADKAVDAVLIATPNDVHAAYVEAAAKAGKHIICEKPIGMSVKVNDMQIWIFLCHSSNRTESDKVFATYHARHFAVIKYF